MQKLEYLNVTWESSFHSPVLQSLEQLQHSSSPHEQWQSQKKHSGSRTYKTKMLSITTNSRILQKV